LKASFNLVIRFRPTKIGALNKSYDIVVCSKRARARGAFYEKLGCYSAFDGHKVLHINGMALGYWVNRGAVVKWSVMRQLLQFGFDLKQSKSSI
jgi:ribosomal protein S16